MLSLQGELVHNTLSDLWQQRQQVIQGIKVIELSALSRVDSAGLALLVHLSVGKTPHQPLMLQGVTPELHSLIMLYNLQDVLAYKLSA